RDLARERAELIDHSIDGHTDAEELAANGLAVDLERHLLRQIAFGDRDEDARDLGRRTNEVADERVVALAHRFPAAAKTIHPHALAHLAVATDDARDARELERGVIETLCEVVVRLGDLARDAVAR